MSDRDPTHEDKEFADPSDTDTDDGLPPRSIKHDLHGGGLDQLLVDPPDTDDDLPPRSVKHDLHSGGLDQLLDRLPETDHHRGRFAGYEAGTGARRFILIALVLASIGAVVAGYMYITYLHNNRTPVHAVPLPEGTDISKRPRTMTWSSGKARLGLTREPPGLLEIELPDRLIRLAEGCDSAQVRLNVENGKTIEMIVLFGEVDELPRPTATP
ncbi:MAG TPA: hypothetical protein ENK31_01785 [Nannocystis exedens]|nr:hypothetical protein [Nannocystis exedens]